MDCRVTVLVVISEFSYALYIKKNNNTKIALALNFKP